MYTKLSTDTNDYNKNREKCRQLDSILPEPKSYEDMEFLTNMDADLFVLGMRKQPDCSWVWDSDGTLVVNQNWSPNEPLGGQKERCALMWRDPSNAKAKRWEDFDCNKDTYKIPTQKPHLICQKPVGKWESQIILILFNWYLFHSLFDFFLSYCNMCIFLYYISVFFQKNYYENLLN